MSDVDYSRVVKCGRDRICELLMRRDFLVVFAEKQHPLEYDVEIRPDDGSSTIHWIVSTEGIPGIFRGRIGKTVPIRLLIRPAGVTGAGHGAINVDLEGKISGQMRADFELLATENEADATAMNVKGSLTVNLGLLSGTASSMVRDELVLPTLDELTDLVEAWSAAPRA